MSQNCWRSSPLRCGAPIGHNALVGAQDQSDRSDCLVLTAKRVVGVKAVVLFTGCAVVGLATGIGGDSRGWYVTLGFGMFVLLSVATSIAPLRLEFDGVTLTRVVLWQRTRFDLRLCSEFRASTMNMQVGPLGRKIATPMIVFDYDGEGWAKSRRNRWNTRLSGSNAGFGADFGTPASEVADTLNRWRRAAIAHRNE